MTRESESSRERIVDFLTGVDRRLRRNEALQHASLGAWGLAGFLIVLRLSGAWDSPALRFALLGSYLAGFAGVVVWIYTRERGLSRSAAVVDDTADLKDALKSAMSFLGLPTRTDWMKLQIDRSAESTRELAAVEMAPTHVPHRLYYASAAGVLLFSLFSWNPAWFRELEQVDLLAAFQPSPAEQVEALLDEAEALAPEEEKLEELTEALERLRRRDLELTESLQELGEIQDALAASRAELEQFEMDLQQLGDQLSSAASLSELSEALKSKNTAEAAELLKQLAERLSNAESSEELQALLEALKNASVQNQELAEMLENLENAAGDMTPQDLAQMAEALQAMAEQMESMGQQQMAAQQDMEQMGQEMQQLEASLGEQQQGQQQQQMGEQQEASGQAMQSQAGMMSNQMQMAQMQGDPSSAVPVDAGPAGDSTGPGGGGEEEILGEATTLDVQLETEILSPEEDELPVPEEIFERLSREEKSTLNYENVQARGRYAEESALHRERVPWQYRALVRRYFLSILTNAESTEQP